MNDWRCVARAMCMLSLMAACACSTGNQGGTSSSVSPDSAAEQSSPVTPFPQSPGGENNLGGTGQGKASSGEVGQLQAGAASMAERIESGDGLRVVNKTGGPVTLVLPKTTGRVDAGKSILLLMPCNERLPVRVEHLNGEFIAEFDGPCRQRDTWTVALD